MKDKARIFSMANLNNSDPLTLTERKELIKGCMTVLLEEDDRLSNLGMLLSKYEETIRALEAQLAEAQAKLQKAVNALRLIKAMPHSHEAIRTCIQTLADIDAAMKEQTK